jgi:hypothetical protein
MEFYFTKTLQFMAENKKRGFLVYADWIVKFEGGR